MEYPGIDFLEDDNTCFRGIKADLKKLCPDEMVRVAEELYLRQISLQMQNQQLIEFQTKLEELQRNYSKLFDHAPVSYFILDRRGIILNVNSAGALLLDKEKDLLCGTPFSTFVHADSFRPFLQHLENIAGAKEPSGCEIQLAVQKQVLHVSLKSIPVKTRHFSSNGFLTIVNDITKAKEYEQKIEKALETEKKINEMKSCMMSVASHEFMGPLGTILFSVSLIGKYMDTGDSDKKIQHHVHKIKRIIRKLTDDVSGILTYRMVEGGALRSIPEQLGIRHFISQVVQEMILGRDIQMKHTGGELVTLDPRLLRICLGNLLTNALKYSARGTSIYVNSTMSGEGTLTITVQNHGIGIPEEFRFRVFDEFFRLPEAKPFPGQGLGLHITQKLVEAMNGTIVCESGTDQSTRFMMSFPDPAGQQLFSE